MESKLYYNTIAPLLLNVLKTLMAAKEFDAYRLVGGTALSLYRGHRQSVDIDLFSDAQYDSIDFVAIDLFLRKTYSYVDTNESKAVRITKTLNGLFRQPHCFLNKTTIFSMIIPQSYFFPGYI